MSLSEHVVPGPPDILERAGLDPSTLEQWEQEQRELLVTALSTWALKEYIRLRQEGASFEIVDPRVTTATEAAIGASAMLSAVNLETFELAMWQGMGSI
jgi:hypothetical protein